MLAPSRGGAATSLTTVSGIGMACRRSSAHERRTTSVMTHRRRVALLGALTLALFPLASPAQAASCGRSSSLAQLPGGRPLADPVPHIPINGTAGFYVPGANT